MDESQRRRVCQLIAGIVVSDDDLDDQEDAFITRMLTKFSIPLEEREVIFPIIDSSEAAASILTLPESVRDEAFSLLVEAACVDGKVVDEEREYLEKVAEALDLSSELDTRIKQQLGG
ncbi:MAG: hypothetical protein R3B89_21665 [Polyangiaceae bacterium]